MELGCGDGWLLILRTRVCVNYVVYSVDVVVYSVDVVVDRGG